MKKPLGVLHVIPSVSRLRGGPSLLLRCLAASLVRSGLRVDIATTDDDGPGRMDVPHGTPLVEEGVRYWYFPRQSHFYTISLPLSRWLSRNAATFDVIHVHALFTFPSLPAAYWATKSGVPYLVRPLGTLGEWGLRNRRPWLKRVSYPLLERRILNHATFVHFTSRSEFTEARPLGFETPSVVIPNAFDEREAVGGVGERFRRRHPGLAGRRMALFLSRLDPKKGLDLLLAAFSRLREPNPLPVLVVAGTGPPDFVSGLRRQALSLGLAERVLFTGPLEGEEKRDALAAADLFVLPSYSENFGIAAVEAMAAGLPVVVSDQVGIHEEIAAAGAGLVVPCQANAVADALRDGLLDGKAERGGRAKALCRERFSVEAVTGQLIRLYLDVCAGSPGSREELGRLASSGGGR